MPEPLEPPSPYWVSDEGDVTLYLDDCLDALRAMEADSIDAIVTDPPAGIAFMDREWDDFRRARNPADAGRDNVFGRTSAHGPEYGRRDRGQFVQMLTERMAEAYRVLKPGGHALVWSIPRTSHWTAWAIEDAGFDIRDCVLHLFGSGFPKSHNISVAIDKLKRRDYVLAAIELGLEVPGNNLHDWTKAEHSPGDEWWERFKAHLSPEQWGTVERAVIARNASGKWHTIGAVGIKGGDYDITVPATEDAARWSGFGTALKPGQEIWWLARKPLGGRTVAANVLEFGTGALNIAACRVHTAGSEGKPYTVKRLKPGATLEKTGGNWRPEDDAELPWEAGREYSGHTQDGRWPSNIVFTHSASCEMTGTRLVRGDSRSGQPRGQRPGGFGDIGADSGDEMPNGALHGDQEIEVWACADDCPVAELDRQSGSIPTQKTRTNPDRESDGGLFGLTGKGTRSNPGAGETGGASRFYPVFRYQAKAPSSERPRLEDGTAHETVKSLDLTRWQVRLITPPGGTVLDLFGGSGPVAEACIIEGFRCVLVEQDPKSAELIKTRLSKPIQPTLFGLEAS